jgi:hypothetical protein
MKPRKTPTFERLVTASDRSCTACGQVDRCVKLSVGQKIGKASSSELRGPIILCIECVKAIVDGPPPGSGG